MSSSAAVEVRVRLTLHLRQIVPTRGYDRRVQLMLLVAAVAASLALLASAVALLSVSRFSRTEKMSREGPLEESTEEDGDEDADDDPKPPKPCLDEEEVEKIVYDARALSDRFQERITQISTHCFLFGEHITDSGIQQAREMILALDVLLRRLEGQPALNGSSKLDGLCRGIVVSNLTYIGLVYSRNLWSKHGSKIGVGDTMQRVDFLASQLKSLIMED